MTATLKPGTRCECRVDHGTIENDKSHLPCCPHWEPGEDWQCYAHAVRLVTYRPMVGMVQGLKVTRALCDACARYHEEGDEEEEPANAPCEKCGRTDMPLHVDYLCPDCHEEKAL